jgi:ribose transport system ATP-binding protein
MNTVDNRPILEMSGITKTFPGVRALNNVNFDLRPGEIHALLGENGAGKSTLIKVLGGIHEPDSGEIRIGGDVVKIESPAAATALGIAMIHQELNVIPGLSVADNILLGQHPIARTGFIRNRELYGKAQAVLDQLGVELSATAPVGPLPAASKQLVLICQALSRNPRLLVMDEPTSALGDADIDRLFVVLQRFAAQGVAIIYISHKLDEIFRLADRVTVLRDGRLIGTRSVAETSHDELVTMMVGRDLGDMYPKRPVPAGELLFEVRDFVAGDAPAAVSFKLRRGEILGMFGLLGSGRTRLVSALFGAIPAQGRVFVEGREVKIHSPRDARAAGLGYLPIERKREGLVLPMTVGNNLLLANYPAYASLGFMQDRRMIQASERWIESLHIACTGRDQITRTLSGGNQQKVVLGRWLEAQSKVLILNSPTQGIDVGAKVEIYSLMEDLCLQGSAVIFVSSEMPELLGIADRILVMSSGRFTDEFTRQEATQENLMHAAIGTRAAANAGSSPQRARDSAPPKTRDRV